MFKIIVKAFDSKVWIKKWNNFMWVVSLDCCKPFLCKSKLYMLERVESIFLNIWTKFHKPLTSFVEQLGKFKVQAMVAILFHCSKVKIFKDLLC
jgi:hypothetical protein